jgi:hypothetical protein
MRPPEIEVRLTLTAPGESWSYIVRRHGEVLAAFDGDDHFSNIGEALKAAIQDAKQTISNRSQGGRDD